MKRRTKRTTGIVVPVNPLATSTSGMSADSGNLMPSAIHGSMVEEDVGEVDKDNIPETNGIRWIRLDRHV